MVTENMMIDIWLALGSFLLGWFVSVIINYIADVLPIHRKLSGIVCQQCKSKTSWKRFIVLAPCAICGKKYPWRHFLVLATITIIFFVLTILKKQPIIELVSDFAVIAFFALIIVIDIEHHLILHVISLAGSVLLGSIGWYNHGWLNTLIGGAVGLLVMLVLYFIGIVFGRAISQKRQEAVEEGLGFGDVILCFVCGLLLGWPGITIGLFAGIVLGGVYSLFLVIITAIKKQYHSFMVIPYGPFLAISALIFWLFRQ